MKDVYVRIIPVLDLKGGQVVHAVAGNRQHYQPIQSVLAEEAIPAVVALAFFQKLGTREVYVADLDAIAGAEPADSAYQSISDAGLRIWLDAGINSIEEFRRVRSLAGPAKPHRLILALESLGPQELREIAQYAPTEELVFSLDLCHGQPITSQSGWRAKTPLEILASAVDLGIETAIVLDLADVGTGCGLSSLGLYHQIRQHFPSVRLVPGGGIRGTEDLTTLSRIGCWGALVASAIHQGNIVASDIETLLDPIVDDPGNGRL